MNPVAEDLRIDRLFQHIDSTTGCIKQGSSSSPVSLSSAAKANQIYVTNSATSGDSRGLYLRQYLTGAGGGGEALRTFSTINAAGATAHGAHISLNFGSSGSLSGLGVAGRNTLHIPDNASWTGGTLSALQAEIYSDGAASDPDGLTELSFLRIINDGHASGKADVDDDGYLMSLQGLSAGAAHIFATGLTAATVQGNLTASLRIHIGSTDYYIPLATAIT
jgi:hypothetical protein